MFIDQCFAQFVKCLGFNQSKESSIVFEGYLTELLQSTYVKHDNEDKDILTNDTATHLVLMQLLMYLKVFYSEGDSFTELIVNQTVYLNLTLEDVSAEQIGRL